MGHHGWLLHRFLPGNRRAKGEGDHLQSRDDQQKRREEDLHRAEGAHFSIDLALVMASQIPCINCAIIASHDDSRTFRIFNHLGINDLGLVRHDQLDLLAPGHDEQICGILRHHQHAVLGCRLNVPHGQIKILPHICDEGRSLDLLVDVHQHARLLVDGQRLRICQALGAEEVELTIRRRKFAGIVVLDPGASIVFIFFNPSNQAIFVDGPHGHVLLLARIRRSEDHRAVLLPGGAEVQELS
mmetsp:Transcript_12138/g.20889  ORF Transcript_12138/g.20889 Transcript_12138/m.20889 type:complete len:242 (+) Transcript_12138:1267-1992(+)